jgi:hypothetical protein
MLLEFRSTVRVIDEYTAEKVVNRIGSSLHTPAKVAKYSEMPSKTLSVRLPSRQVDRSSVTARTRRSNVH